MKTKNNYGQSVQDANKKIYTHLKRINDLIKNPLSRELGFEKLQEVDSETLNGGLCMYYYYVKGKYYSLLYRDAQDKDIELLLRANDCFDDLVFTARENDIQIKNVKYLFTRAQTKFALSQGVAKSELKQRFLSQAERLTTIALRTDATNSSFVWLNNQIKG